MKYVEMINLKNYQFKVVAVATNGEKAKQS
jgi:hypothetical protein